MQGLSGKQYKGSSCGKRSQEMWLWVTGFVFTPLGIFNIFNSIGEGTRVWVGSNSMKNGTKIPSVLVGKAEGNLRVQGDPV